MRCERWLDISTHIWVSVVVLGPGARTGAPTLEVLRKVGSNV